MSTSTLRFPCSAVVRLLQRLRSVPAGLAAAAAILLLFAVGAAQAQGPADQDPPGRVARLGEVNGQVWFYSPDNGDWIAAVRNQPVTNGDRLATDAGARAELQLGSTTVRLDGGSELEVVSLDDTQFNTRLHDGSIALRVRDAAGAGRFGLSTDDGRFLVDRAGSYRFDRNAARSVVTVLSGQARYEGPNSALAVGPDQRDEFWIDSGGVAQYSSGPPVNDAFAAWSGERDRRVIVSATQRYVSPEMTGAEDLDRYGRWEDTPDYGALWVPASVPVDWAPYAYGHWAWVQPWGWTWVDDAPWGFAPFHYGRWVYARERWCWTPGARTVRPVYAPALVAWVGGPRAELSVSIGGGRGGPPVGWIPLAPREVYVPSHHYSPHYIREVNITNVTNVTVINNVISNPQAPRDFGNRHFPHAITVVPGGVLTSRQPVAPAAAQARQLPWVRDLANQPGRPMAMIAPPVEGPVSPNRGAGGRPVALPPSASPEARGGPGRPGFQARERDVGRPNTGMQPPLPMGEGNPAQRLPAPAAPGLAGAANPGQRPGALSPPPASIRPSEQNPATEAPRGQRGFDNRPDGRAGQRPDMAPPPPRGESGLAPARPAPATQTPAPTPPAAPAAIAPPPPAVREERSMRTMPFRANDEGRPAARRNDAQAPNEPQRLPSPQAPSAQPPAQAQPQLQRIERPAAPPQRPVEPAAQMQAPRPVEVPRQIEVQRPPAAQAPAPAVPRDVHRAEPGTPPERGPDPRRAADPQR